ncbi:MAG: cardiolipin synthase [Bacteroidales bacterium]|nr:cardiolipin synthase [Bacteroidales bacterium]MBQ8811292.1 cardiolipin synthase [Bacteroidales bacterium]
MTQALTIIGGIFFLLLIAGAVLVIINDNQDSGRKVAWILIIAILPVIGLLLYFAFGLNFRKPGFFQIYNRTFLKEFEEKASPQTKELLFGDSHAEEIRPRYRSLSRLLSRDSGLTVTDHNEIEIITSGGRKLEALVNDLLAAKHHIHFEYFYFLKDDGSRRIKELLMQKAREGVKVRFIHENIANITIWPSYYNEMKEAGVEVVKFTEPNSFILSKFNYRDHRKIVVIDGKVGYTGGMNIGDDYFFRWRDTHTRITGNAVASLQYCFLNSWITSGGKIEDNFDKFFPQERVVHDDKLVQIIPDEPDRQFPILHMGAVWTTQHSSRYLYIQTPYFVPPEPLLLALKSAALKGCDVRLMVPAKADLFFMGPANRSFYTECLEAGIRIFEKGGRFIHSKTLVSDDYLSVIGSANMDCRSLELSYEINAYIFNEEIARKNRKIFLDDLKECREIRLEEWNSRKWYRKFIQSIMRLFAPLL